MNYQDRGNKKWTAMFLPEHRDRLHEWALSQSDITHPILANDELEELNHSIHLYLQDHSSVNVSFYKDKQIKNINGILHGCDLQNGFLVMYNQDEKVVRISLSNILSIKKVEKIF
ncbi:YolD-like family protein [Paenibacillus hunanensis]|uniref:YolD-like family protein n=1 Tax=Paenibacillus hunanensis TaxID=539262 RepID=A0ABU1IWY8_9BACL|nr:YolD-like family protein [Paenibacillus hunanensis]MDR6243515.1 hypothetical protein [Paenibacillus hunanensis]GGI98311.1 hypothetical protein GCM10008022_03780 [Paenibacillus hunanensis]